MSQRQRMQGQPMIIMGDDAQRVKDRNAQEYNISAARAVAQSVRSTLGPKGMDKMLVDSMGDVTVTNDGVTILQEMDIDNPTAEMIVEVAETQEDEAGDGTTTAVAIAGELLREAEDLLDQDVHPTSIIRGFDEASTFVRSTIDEIAEPVAPDDEATLRSVAETAMTGKGAEVNKELLAELIVDAVRAVSVETEDGGTVVDLDFVAFETQSGRSAAASELVSGAVVDKDPVHDDMPTDFDEASIMLLNDPIEVDEADVDATVSVDSHQQVERFVEQEEQQLREKVEHIADTGADVVFCQKGIDDLAQHFLAQHGILAVRRTRKSDVEFMREVLGASVVTDLQSATADDLGRGRVTRDESAGHFVVEGLADDSHGVTLLLRGSTDHVADELERGVQDAMDVVAGAVTDGRLVAGGGAIEVELARRLRSHADSIGGREQLAVEAFADAIELVPRVLAGNAGLDPIDTLVDLRAAHEAGDAHAGLDVFADDVVDSFEAGVVEPAAAKQQAVSSATEAANLVLKIDDVIAAGDLDDDDGGPGAGGPGPM